MATIDDPAAQRFIDVDSQVPPHVELSTDEQLVETLNDAKDELTLVTLR